MACVDSDIYWHIMTNKKRAENKSLCAWLSSYDKDVDNQPVMYVYSTMYV